MLLALAGLIGATGTVRLGERDLLRLSIGERATVAAFMPQTLPQGVALTVLESVIAAGRASPLGDLAIAGEELRRRAVATLDRLGVSDLALEFLDRLSGGQRQLVGLAQALVREPQLLLLDEPTSALDLRHQVGVMTLVRALASEGRTVMVVLHDLNLAMRWADRIVRRHLETMARLNIGYDLLTWEGDILRLHFWTHAFEFLKRTGAVFLQTEGKLKGCWVMRIEDEAAAPAEAEQEGEGEEEQREKVIVRSDGTVTYVGKDMAYQLWKFGLLGRDFHYRPFASEHDEVLWSTTSDPGVAEAGAPAFGRASWVCNVIDTRQSYLQKLVKQALAALGYHEQAAHSIHYSYEMVALSHSTARELGYDTSIDADRPFVEVSGRKGLGVKADDLIDRLIDKASQEVARRNADLPAADVRRIAEAIAIAAVRYFMVKFSRGKVIVFDIDEALSFEGESGPYLQYAVVRANNIFNKLKERANLDEAAVSAALASTPTELLTSDSEEAHEVWGLVLEAARLDEMVEQAVRMLELSVIAKYAFGLAQAFNGFYHRYPILNEERTDARIWRAAAVAYCRKQLTTALDLMGCSVPGRM